MKLKAIITAAVAFAFVHAAIIHAADRPSTGRAVPAFAPLDRVVNDFMDVLGAEASSLAVTNNGRLVYSRGYGWSDAEKTKPTQIENTFRIASNTKPFTAAIVRHLIQAGRLSLETPVFQYLDLRPYNGTVGDQRPASVTIQHLLEHQGGWDHDQTYDPTYTSDKIKTEMNLDSQPTTTQIIEYMLAQPLQFAPGERRAYSNFGYMTLGRVIEKATGQKYGDVLQTAVCRPLRITDIRLSATKVEDRDRKEVFYPMESELDIALRDSLGGLTSSAPSLCAFLQKYWISGELRDRRQTRSYYHSGSHPNSTTALMEQRTDGIDYAVLFNARRNERFTEDIAELRTAINTAIDQIKASGR